MVMPHWCKLTILLTSLLLSGWNSALAQTFPAPNRSITFVVGLPAGRGIDIMGGALAQELTRELGNSVIVENRPGPAGAISVQTVARADPDAYTLLRFGYLGEARLDI